MPSLWADANLSRQIFWLVRARRIPSTVFRELRNRAIEINVSRLLQALVRERFLEPDSEALPSAVTFAPYARARSTCFTRYEIDWTVDDRGRRITDRSIGHIVSWLRHRITAHLKATEWEVVCDCFRQSLTHTIANLILERGIASDSAAIERNANGHNLYPFPTFRRGIALHDIEHITNLSQVPISIPLFVARDMIYTSATLSTRAECNRKVFGVSDSWAGEPLLPIHPWQLKYSDPLQREVGRRLQPTGIYLRGVPLVSLRTFQLTQNGHHLKLPVNAVITSARRLLYQMYCQNTIPIGELIALFEGTGALPSSIAFQRDIMTLSVPDMELAPHLSAIVREPLTITSRVQPAVDIWYGPALAEMRWRDLTLGELQESWHRYCQVVIEGPVRLLANHGIAVEPHLQNTAIEFDGTLARRIIIRDLDHAILDRDIVESHVAGLGKKLFPYTWEYMPSAEEGIGRLVHDLFHAHLGEAILFLEKRCGASLPSLCQTALEVLEDQRQHMHTPRAARTLSMIRASMPRVRALLRMRLANSEQPVFV